MRGLINFAALLTAVSLLAACASPKEAVTARPRAVAPTNDTSIISAPLPPPAIRPVPVVAAAVSPVRFVGKPEPFIKGLKSPAELASRIQASLDRDPTGNSVVDPERCKLDKSCATPLEYLAMLQQKKRRTKIESFSDMQALLRRLVVVDAPPGEYWMACRRRDGKNKSHPVLHCLSRTFKPGEKAWIDPETREIEFAEDCTNPVERPVSLECATIAFPVRVKDIAARFAILGPAFTDNGCLGIRRPGDTEYQAWWPQECEYENCAFDAASTVLGKPVRIAGSIIIDVSGVYELRVPKFLADSGALYVTVLCLDNESGYTDGRGVNWFEYQDRSTRSPRAIVWRSKAEVPASAPPLYFTEGDWERWGYVPVVAPASAFTPDRSIAIPRTVPPPAPVARPARQPARAVEPPVHVAPAVPPPPRPVPTAPAGSSSSFEEID